MDGIPHHLISFLEPTYSDYNVQDFKNDALEIIHKIWDNNKVPILVGGTGYYIESVIYWNHLIETDKQITGKKIVSKKTTYIMKLTNITFINY
jgi:tRNA dimethylallyltransferase